jgi:hypothetical protein
MSCINLASDHRRRTAHRVARLAAGMALFTCARAAVAGNDAAADVAGGGATNAQLRGDIEVADGDIRAAIEKGKRALLDHVVQQDELEIDSGPRRGTLRGRVVGQSDNYIVLQTDNGDRLSVPRRNVREWRRAGLVRQEMDAPHRTGPSTLAAVALVAAGVETRHPALATLIEALAAADPARMGTYVRSLRAQLWALLLDRPLTATHRQRYRRLLRADVNWLVSARLPDGGYTYTALANPHPAMDHSNTQFGDLGLWAGDIGRAEISPGAWQRMADHWLRTQRPDGGWTYSSSPMPSTSSMTVAGCNSLYIALDRFYGRANGPYVLFEGCRPNQEARRQMLRLTAAIERGDRFLAANPPNPLEFHGYELFGLERLGLASGQVRIGDRDWFDRYAWGVARRAWGKQVIADAFALIFLVHGQAPVLIQKLEHGEDLAWNYYPRDLPSLARYWTRTFERLVRWQRLPADAPLTQMQDAPLLYIAGTGALELPDRTERTLRRYIDDGGTVFLHADRAAAAFTRSAQALFERMFEDRGLRFGELAKDHPVYRCHFGGKAHPWKRHVPLRALEDDFRILVYLCPVDIAGYWQQERGRHHDLLRIMANVRIFSAPPYSELPSRLTRRQEDADEMAPHIGSIALARPPLDGCTAALPHAWPRYGAELRRRTGLHLDAAAPPADAADAWTAADVVHLPLRRAPAWDDATRRKVGDYLRAGGLLLVDAAAGRPESIAAVHRLLDEIDAGEPGVLEPSHPIVTGAMAGGHPLEKLEATDAGAGLVRGDAPPPILTRTVGGRISVLACPFDLLAGLNGAYVWNRSGYRRESTLRIVDNLLLWRFAEVQGRATGGGGQAIP